MFHFEFKFELKNGLTCTKYKAQDVDSKSDRIPEIASSFPFSPESVRVMCWSRQDIF